jgi:hypothetical protein
MREELADNRSIEVMMLLELESLKNPIQYSTIQSNPIQIPRATATRLAATIAIATAIATTAIAIALTKTIVNGNFSEFILQDANLPLVLLFEDVIDKGCLAGPKKSSNDGDGGQRLGVFFCGHGGSNLKSSYYYYGGLNVLRPRDAVLSRAGKAQGVEELRRVTSANFRFGTRT